MRTLNSVLSFAALLALSFPSYSQTPAPAQAPAKSATAAKPKSASPTYDRTLLKPALLKEKAPDTFQVKFETTRGDFTMDVTRAWAPLGVDRFYNLVRHHYYDNMVLFRVVPGFVVQFGISSYPPVNAAWKDATIKDDPVLQSNKRGYVTFATSGPNSRTTQIFINFGDNSRLDSMGFAPFATINHDGMKVVEMFYDQYAEGPTNQQDAIQKQGKAYLDKNYPKLDVIKQATIVGTPPLPAPKPTPKPTAKPASSTKPASTTPASANP
jgi:peptidyl-prolyl cis-trans isomerase A (cyclophilin A)